MFPIAVPGIVFGTGIFWTYILTPLYGTIWVLVLAFVASYLPFAYRISDTSLLQIDCVARGGVVAVRRVASDARRRRSRSG